MRSGVDATDAIGATHAAMIGDPTAASTKDKQLILPRPHICARLIHNFERPGIANSIFDKSSGLRLAPLTIVCPKPWSPPYYFADSLIIQGS